MLLKKVLCLFRPHRDKLALTVCFLLPAGVLMGFAFPTGMVTFGEANKAWFWAVNGAASVLASVSSLALSMTFGFEAVALAGVALYGVAVLALKCGRPTQPPAEGVV